MGSRGVEIRLEWRVESGEWRFILLVMIFGGAADLAMYPVLRCIGFAGCPALRDVRFGGMSGLRCISIAMCPAWRCIRLSGGWLANLCQHARTGTLTLETLQSAFQRFVFLDSNLRHLLSLPSPLSPGYRCFPQRTGDRGCIIPLFPLLVNTFF